MPVEHVSRNFLAAVIAHEDAALPYRSGAFEWDELWSRAQAHLAGEEDPSGSTIPQQVAKNLFLNQELSAWRKAVEAGMAVELAAFIDDRRMLELYVNYAQFGPTHLRRLRGRLVLTSTPRRRELSAAAGRAAGGPAPLPRARPARARRRHGLRGRRRPGLAVPLARAQRRRPGCRAHLERLGFQPVEDAGVEGLASDAAAVGRRLHVSRRTEVTELIEAEGTA